MRVRLGHLMRVSRTTRSVSIRLKCRLLQERENDTAMKYTD